MKQLATAVIKILIPLVRSYRREGKTSFFCWRGRNHEGGEIRDASVIRGKKKHLGEWKFSKKDPGNTQPQQKGAHLERYQLKTAFEPLKGLAGKILRGKRSSAD